MSYGGLPNNYNAWPNDPEKKEWTFERIHKLGRQSYYGFPADGGIRMQCKKLAVKVSKGIQLTEHDIYYLERLRSEEHTSELQSRRNLVCRLLLEKKKK
mgnify:CR=1 FL=1